MCTSNDHRSAACRHWASALCLALVVALSGAQAASAAPVAQTRAEPATVQSALETATPLQMGAHVVRSGESLFTIAQRYQLSPAELAHLNGRPISAVLLPGKSLRVPLSQAVNARAGVPAAADAGGVGSSDHGRSASPRSMGTHTVRAGDTLYAIARTYGVAVDDLRRWNGLPADGLIRVGETLRVAVQEGFGGEATSDGPPGTAPSAGPSRPNDETYIVQAGDTLSAIAVRQGTTAVALMRLNDLTSDFLQVGQGLRLPRPGAGPQGASGPKRIEVDISEQRMYVWQGETLVWNFTVSTGLAGYPTRRGTFAVQSKVPNAWSSAWQLWMPHWLGIYWAGPSENGIHSLPIVNGQRLWGGYLGTPISYGCVVLGVQEAELLYNWAEIGTPVIIRD